MALAGVDLDVRRGSTLVIVGRSGSGKSTLARLIAGLDKPSSGCVCYLAAGEADCSSDVKVLRSRVQLVFQETDWALDPRFTAAQSIEEPLRLRTSLSRRERRRKALDFMELVGLPVAWADRLPAQFSGGQRKRISIARSLAAAPEVLVLDEPFTGLDLSAQARIVNVLLQIRKERDLTLLLVLHDIAVAAALGAEVAVLLAGKFVDRCTADELCRPGRHPHTEALVRASLLREEPEQCDS